MSPTSSAQLFLVELGGAGGYLDSRAVGREATLWGTGTVPLDVSEDPRLSEAGEGMGAGVPASAPPDKAETTSCRWQGW